MNPAQPTLILAFALPVSYTDACKEAFAELQPSMGANTLFSKLHWREAAQLHLPLVHLSRETPTPARLAKLNQALPQLLSGTLPMALTPTGLAWAPDVQQPAALVLRLQAPPEWAELQKRYLAVLKYDFAAAAVPSPQPEIVLASFAPLQRPHLPALPPLGALEPFAAQALAVWTGSPKGRHLHYRSGASHVLGAAQTK